MPGQRDVMTDDQLYNEYRSGSQQAGDTLMLRYADVVTAYLEGFLNFYENVCVHSYCNPPANLCQYVKTR